MKVILNNINIYNNVVIINHVHDNRTFVNNENLIINKRDEDDSNNPAASINIQDNEDHPLIAQFEARILQIENEKRELLDQLNSENK
jgi:hypothetical protein